MVVYSTTKLVVLGSISGRGRYCVSRVSSKRAAARVKLKIVLESWVFSMCLSNVSAYKMLIK